MVFRHYNCLLCLCLQNTYKQEKTAIFIIYILVLTEHVICVIVYKIDGICKQYLMQGVCIMNLKKTKKVMYEVRYVLNEDNISAVFSKHSDKTEAIDAAKFISGKENDRLYFVKQITKEVIFVVGKRR